MATIFFDTCAIRFLVKQKRKGAEIKYQLSQHGHIPIIGRNTLHECAEHHDTCSRQETFNFIEDMNPEYTLTREEFYKNEILKFKYDSSFSYWANPEHKKEIKKTNMDLIAGNYSTEVQNRFEEREQSIIKAQSEYKKLNLYHPKNKSKLNGSFDERVLNMLKNELIPAILNLLFEQMNLNLSTDEIKKLLSKIDKYPALRTLLRAKIYMSEHIHSHPDSFRKDIITDAIQLTEAAYSTTFVSEDEELVQNIEEQKEEIDLYGRKLNPDIELLTIHDFIKHIAI